MISFDCSRWEPMVTWVSLKCNRLDSLLSIGGLRNDAFENSTRPPMPRYLVVSNVGRNFQSVGPNPAQIKPALKISVAAELFWLTSRYSCYYCESGVQLPKCSMRPTPVTGT